MSLVDHTDIYSNSDDEIEGVKINEIGDLTTQNAIIINEMLTRFNNIDFLRPYDFTHRGLMRFALLKLKFFNIENTIELNNKSDVVKKMDEKYAEIVYHIFLVIFIYKMILYLL